MSDSPVDRRTLLKTALAGLVALPAAGLVVREATAADVPHLDEKDPLAVAMAYTSNASKLDPAKNPPFKAGSKCANCVQLSGKEGDEWRPCNLFPGKLVNQGGWCKVWTLKPGAKV
ncbi:MAG TPA: high-potential iron-sulfur protein [Povalibacter sp.]|nr:high-potential iron-sulfur protein [Povalibacter sp.]